MPAAAGPAPAAEGPHRERARLLKQKTMGGAREDRWLDEASKSPAAQRIDKLMAKATTEQEREQLKRETFKVVYDNLGQELEGKDLERVVVIRNEAAGYKTMAFFAIFTLGFYLVFRGRDDDIMLVLTKQGNVIQLKIDRPLCCPGTSAEALQSFIKYIAILFFIVVLPNVVFMLATNMTLQDEYEYLKAETDNFKHMERLISQKLPFIVISAILLVLWLYSLLPHDYMDEHRRRHMARECTTAQICQWGHMLARRHSLHLYFGKYPSQHVLDMQGSLGFGHAVSTVPPSSLSALSTGISTSALILSMTLFLTLVTSVDTGISWMDRAIALEHFATMQGYCIEGSGPTDARCNKVHCDEYIIHGHDTVNPHFCNLVEVSESEDECIKYGKSPPCCGGCAKGAFEGVYDEGTFGNIKTIISLVADTGTIIFVFLAAKHAVHMTRATDHVAVTINRRTKRSYKTLTANTALTVPLANDFLQTVMNQNSKDHGMKHSFEASEEDQDRWTGVKHFAMTEEFDTWKDFFNKDLHAVPDTRWTLRLQVPKKLFGIEQDEDVIAAWIEMPLLPPSISLMDILMGKVWYLLLPFGKTRHAVVVTDRRLFYVRHRRPFLPIKCLGTDLRVDVFRHDHDVTYGKMARHKLNTPQRIIHQILLREMFLPGTAVMQTKFGAIQFTRNHGDIIDVYNMIMSLSRHIPEFVTEKDLVENGVVPSACKEIVDRAFIAASNKQGNRFTIRPQSDDAVQPQPTLYLASGSKERVLFHLSVKDTTDIYSKCYVNLDIAVTSARVFFWKRDCYKKFDCCALPCWLFIWLGFMNRMNKPMNLPNEMSFITLPSIQSFSTDVSVVSPSWLVPHHMPLKWPCVEMLCAYLTRCVVRGSHEVKIHSKWVLCPRRSGPSANLLLMWRLKASAHADAEMFVVHQVQPFVSSDMPETDAQDIFDGMSYIAEDGEAASDLVSEQAESLETLRKIMCAVQDSCHALLNKVDDLGGSIA
ncbi:unnamed protein product [Prorocentrum cordatum]|uniref:Uncharacterized protein n=1 Tax=Prorocentrum cordatum TaxID=2364126 RepID=A0ABN9RZK9_9DINO|nr:unnamed protein product [Polarella glacialis]